MTSSGADYGEMIKGDKLVLRGLKFHGYHGVKPEERGVSIVRDVVEGAPQNLLESVAHLIASKVLSKYPQVSAVRVQVGKPHIAVLGQVDYLGVEIVRQRTTATQS
ncbi:hypothetical protein DH2020_039756 [Rehmannia glutinosa]|uniref:dihydroneopterin aldolase n=1 Tax=Rehmannia glutinosa TaxID=99300 RepID=A0ABR0UWN8_REHGL